MKSIITFLAFILYLIPVRSAEPVKVVLAYDSIDKQMNIKIVNESDSITTLIVKLDPISHSSSYMQVDFLDKDSDRVFWDEFFIAKPDISRTFFGYLFLKPHSYNLHSVSFKNKKINPNYKWVEKIKVTVTIVYREGNSSQRFFRIKEEFKF